VSIQPKYTIDTLNNAATIDLYSSGILVTSYNYENNEVTLEERPNIDSLTISQLVSNLEGIGVWIGLINNYITSVTNKVSRFEEEQKKTNTTIHCKIEIKGDTVSDVLFTESTQLCVFQPRDLIVLSYTNFKKWATFLDIFKRNCLQF
jgi:hypothetical protein